MRIVLPGQEEPEDISTMTQLTQQRILEVDTPLRLACISLTYEGATREKQINNLE